MYYNHVPNLKGNNLDPSATQPRPFSHPNVLFCWFCGMKQDNFPEYLSQTRRSGHSVGSVAPNTPISRNIRHKPDVRAILWVLWHAEG